MSPPTFQPVLRPWEELGAAGRHAEAVEEFVRDFGPVTFAELEQRLAPYLAVAGDATLLLRPGVLVWTGLSPAFADLLTGLVSKGRLHLHPSSAWQYYRDGGRLNVPLLKPGTPPDPDRPCWLPVELLAEPCG